MWDNTGNTEQTEGDSAGFADPLGNGVTAFAWVFIVLLVAFLTWAHKNGSLPLWG